MGSPAAIDNHPCGVMPRVRDLRQSRHATTMDPIGHTLRDVVALYRRHEPQLAGAPLDAERDALWNAYRRTVLDAMRWSDGHGLLCCLVRLLFGDRWNTPLFIDPPPDPSAFVAAGLAPDEHKTALLLAAVATRMILDGEIPPPAALC